MILGTKTPESEITIPQIDIFLPFNGQSLSLKNVIVNKGFSFLSKIHQC